MNSEHVSNFACEIVAHSINQFGCEAITFRLCYERFIHAEFMAHRWSRNASSSRAIPHRKMSDWITRNPAMPLHLGSNRPGMQSGDEVERALESRVLIRGMFQDAVLRAEVLHDDYGLHKEIVNRYTEPRGWINVVATMGRDQLMNFFSLRIDRHANPNMQRLAVRMARLYRDSRPNETNSGEWHLPFTDDIGPEVSFDDRLAWSVARCAWTSYRTVDGKVATIEDAKRRHDSCLALKHVTPCEHQLRTRGDSARSGLVQGFDSYRSMIPGESSMLFDFGILDRDYANRDYLVPERDH